MRVLTLFLMLLVFISHAQVSNYSFSQSSGTYVTITGGSNYDNFTSWSNTVFLDDNSSAALESIGFNFVYNGTTYTQFAVNTNGFITLGALPVNNYSPLSSTVGSDLITPASNNVISAMGRDIIGRGSFLANRTLGSNVITITAGDINQILVGDKVSGNGIPAGATVVSKTATTVTISANATTTGSGFHFRFSRSTFGIRFQTIGTAPNRTLVVQWTGWQRYTTSGAFGELYNFQIRLDETTNIISVIYDILGPTNTTSTTFQVGLRGNSNVDFNNRTSSTNWSSTTSGTINSAVITLSNTVKPASGQTYIWSPPVVPLPIELVSFDGVNLSDDSYLNWTTASEFNSDYFEILRSIDAINYESVGKVDAGDFSTQNLNYTFIDYNLLPNIYYYKLNQVDYNGVYKMHGPVSINIEDKNINCLYKYYDIMGKEVDFDKALPGMYIRVCNGKIEKVYK